MDHLLEQGWLLNLFLIKQILQTGLQLFFRLLKAGFEARKVRQCLMTQKDLLNQMFVIISFGLFFIC
jgi:hypothetical protein